MDPEERQKIYAELKQLLEGYAKDFEVHDDPNHFALWTTKPFTLGKITKDKMYFVGIKPLKNFVGFYFFPLYGSEKLRAKVPASLTKIYKGYTCFNVKELTPEIKEGLTELMEIGMKAFRKNGWL